MNDLRGWLACAFVFSSAATAAGPGEAARRLSVSQEADGVTVRIDGQMFTRYLVRSGTRPVLWPLIGPTEKPVTRAYPVAAPTDGEELDHPHHRSVWFGYEGVNGHDFWCEPEPGVERRLPIGTIAHREFVRADSNGEVAVIATRNDWLNPSGQAVCRDERMLQFGARGDQRWIDFRMTLWSDDWPLTIGDSKEGAFGIRVASTMRVDAKLGGRIVDSRLRMNDDAWGQPAEWVDYQGPIDGETIGIAIMTHPTSYNPTPRNFVRTYGLHAVNPFGLTAYGNDSNGQQGGVVMPAGQPLRLRYRVLIHRGDEREGNVAAAFAAFSRTE